MGLQAGRLRSPRALAAPSLRAAVGRPIRSANGPLSSSRRNRHTYRSAQECPGNADHVGMRGHPVVVIADDSPEMRSFAGRILQIVGCRVIEAPDGEQALAALRSHRCDTLLIDLAMPDMDGIEAIRRIRPEQPRLRIVAMTGAFRMEDGVPRSALWLGAHVVLGKPFTTQQLRKAVLSCSYADVALCTVNRRRCGAMDCGLHRSAVSLEPMVETLRAGLVIQPHDPRHRLRCHPHAAASSRQCFAVTEI